MAGQTWTARQTALDVNAALRKAGVDRTINAKRVRAFVRDQYPSYDDGQYTAHLYDARTHERIVAALVKRYTAGRPASASLGRSTPAAKPAARKSPSTSPKPASVAQNAPETVTVDA